jgi:uncharacterized protein (DUF433 family)
MNTRAISLSETLYERILQLAQQTGQVPDNLVETILWEHLPVYPYIEIKKDRWGRYAVISGTRTSVATVVRYAQMGHDPQAIATEILPHLKPAQVHSALAYYFEHREAVDAEIAMDTTEVWQARLKELVGAEAYEELVGQADS